MKDEFNFEGFLLSKKIKEKLKDKEFIKKELASGKSAQEMMEIPSEAMAQLYRAASHLLENRHFENAADSFLFLATLNPYNHDYWLGLGMATQMTGNYEAAIDAYEMAAISEASSPVPYFYLAKCLFAIHDRESALQAINLAIEYAGAQEEYNELRHQAEKAKQLLLTDR